MSDRFNKPRPFLIAKSCAVLGADASATPCAIKQGFRKAVSDLQKRPDVSQTHRELLHNSLKNAYAAVREWDLGESNPKPEITDSEETATRASNPENIVGTRLRNPDGSVSRGPKYRKPSTRTGSPAFDDKEKQKRQNLFINVFASSSIILVLGWAIWMVARPVPMDTISTAQDKPAEKKGGIGSEQSAPSPAVEEKSGKTVDGPANPLVSGSTNRTIASHSPSAPTPPPTTPAMTSRAKPVVTSPPRHGEVMMFTRKPRMAPLEIQTSPGSHYLLKLTDAQSGQKVMTVFVRGGQPLRLHVPLGDYVFKYATGNTWHGYQGLFGPATIYSKARQPFSFRIEGNRISGYTVTLYKVSNGNLKPQPIQPHEF